MADRVLIGIDPGVTTGLCLYRSKKDFDVKTMGFFQAICLIEKTLISNGIKKIYIESPQFNRAIHNKTHKVGSQSISYALKIAQNVGENKAHAKLWVDWLKNKMLVTEDKIILVVPTRRTPKLTAIQFREITGYSSKCSQHARDACMLVYGK